LTNLSQVNFPPPLSAGALVRVVAPSGPFDPDLLRAGLARLEEFEVRVPEGLYGRREGYFAGPDDVRLSELQTALDCPDTLAIWVARGGYGVARLLPGLDFSEFEKHPKWIVGFSDATCLHSELSRRGFGSLHAANGTTLAGSREGERQELFSILAGRRPTRISGLTRGRGGVVSGPLFGGNLTVLFAEAAAGRLVIPHGALLFIEDVSETSYRIDRMLDALRASKHLDRPAGILVGDFHDCSPGRFQVPTDEVLRTNLLGLGIPVVFDLPVGHAGRIHPLVCGRNARLDPDAGTLSYDG
jgi:muramoyltetrapeptide carboxypeptidase